MGTIGRTIELEEIYGNASDEIDPTVGIIAAGGVLIAAAGVATYKGVRRLTQAYPEATRLARNAVAVLALASAAIAYSEIDTEL